MRVAIADDSALFRDGLTLLLQAADLEVVIQARTGDELLTLIRTAAPDVAILDIRMPPTFTNEGLITAKQLRQIHPQVGILMLSTYAETAYAAQVLEVGARSTGYLLKDRVSDATTLREALARIHLGESVIDPEIISRLLKRQRSTTTFDRLTSREREVMKHMAEGRSNNGIARQMCVSPKTVEHYIATLFAHLGLPESTADNRRVLAVLNWLRSEI